MESALEPLPGPVGGRLVGRRLFRLPVALVVLLPLVDEVGDPLSFLDVAPLPRVLFGHERALSPQGRHLQVPPLASLHFP